jgi:hypothetical protein
MAERQCATDDALGIVGAFHPEAANAVSTMPD